MYGDFVLSDLKFDVNVSQPISLPQSRALLSCMPTSTGYERRNSASYHWDGARRGATPFTILQHTVSGTGHLSYEGRLYRLGPGDTLIATVPHDHAYWAEEGDDWCFFWLSMTGGEALRLHRAVLDLSGPVLRLKDRTLDRLADCCLRLVRGDGETPGDASAIAYQAMMALYDDVFGTERHRGEASGAMAPVISFIAANLDRDLGVDELARILHLSRAHFTRVFTASEGVPPAEYVMMRRMRRAAELLALDPDISVKEVANQTGFDSQSYFSKAFRRTFGASPMEFRTTGMYSSALKR